MSEKTEQPKFETDRGSWGPGPWQDEPDRVEFEAHGLDCLMIRGPVGAWCGYVAVPRGHRAYGKGYDSVWVSVHGGLTYADKCQGHVCHVPKKGRPGDVWWLGFDCAHYNDISPGVDAAVFQITGKRRRGFPGAAYRTAEWVRREVSGLARQLVGTHQNTHQAPTKMGGNGRNGQNGRKAKTAVHRRKSGS